ncbi:MAG: isochorismatase family protein [Deltaproteobacteria bacterium]
MRAWEEIFPEGDRKILEKAGFAAKQPFGRNPALLIIDVNRSFLGFRKGEEAGSTLQAAEGYKVSCGEAGWKALTNIQRLLEHCRKKGILIVFTTGDAVMKKWCGSVTKRSDPTGPIDLDAEEIPPPITPLSSEVVVYKPKASAFFDTPLARLLRERKVDCLLITGVSTSGCVRASVVDAFSTGFPCFVVEECTFDRFHLSHLVNLFDMNAKYADVITLDEAMHYVTSV